MAGRSTESLAGIQLGRRDQSKSGAAVVTGAIALALVVLGVIGLLTGTLDEFLPWGRRNPYTSNEAGRVHSALRAIVVVVAACAVVGSSAVWFWYSR